MLGRWADLRVHSTEWVSAAVGVADVGAVGTGGGGGAAVEAEAFENLLQVHLHRVDGATEDGGDLAIGLALGDPMEHLGLSRR